jgi:hypothetical protein
LVNCRRTPSCAAVIPPRRHSTATGCDAIGVMPALSNSAKGAARRGPTRNGDCPSRRSSGH